MGPAALRFFHSLARKNLTKNQGSGIITIPNRMTSESEASGMIQTIVDSGLPLEKFDQFIKSEEDILKYLNIIKNANKQKVDNQPIDQRKVVNMFDRSAVNPNKPILGGRNIDETEEQIKQRLMDQNKKGIKSLEDRMKKNKEYQDLKKSFDDPEKKAMGGRIGFDDGDFVGKQTRTVAPQDFNEKLAAYYSKQMPSSSPKTPTINPEGITSTIPIEKSPAAPRFMGSIFDFKNIEDEEETESKAMGGRIGYAGGAGKKGVQALLDLVRDKFGKKAITTADKAPIPPKTLERDMFKAADKRLSDKREMTEDEIYDFAEEIGGELDAYDFDGTVGSAKRILKEHKEYMDDMYRQYRMGKLDPEPGDKSEARKIFLQNKLDEMEATGDRKLMTVDEIEELSNFDLQAEMDVAKSLAPKMVERLQLKQKYPGITDDLLDKILIDDNVQRKAEVLATIDEAFKMMEKGKGTDEILDTMKNVTRTKQADGGIMRSAYAGGGMGRRGFLKMLAGIGGGIAAAKTGLLKLAGKEPVKQVAKEVVKGTAGTYPPPYFFKLVEKIKFMGDDITEKAATQERQSVKKYKDYEMTEDMGTGEIVIKKRNEGVFYDQDGIISDEYIVYKPGQADELTKGKKPPPEYDEYTVRPDADGKLRDSEDGLDSIDEILDEVGDSDSMTIKKASGGIARMLGE